MLKVSLSMALTIYLFFNVIIVLFVWMFHSYKKSKILLNKDEDYIRHCNICANIFIDSLDENISRCPRCESLVKKK